MDTAYYRPEAGVRPEPFLLAVSALAPYKRLDLAIRAAAAVRMPLTIVGRGPEERHLRGLAASTGGDVTFTGWLTDDRIRDLYRRCRAVVMPGIEDFGMVPVEAQACGRPAIALGEGGALDSVVDGVTGILVRENTVEAFAAAFRDVATREFDSGAIRRHAETFGKERFQREFQAAVADTVSATYAQERRNFAAREDEQ